MKPLTKEIIYNKFYIQIYLGFLVILEKSLTNSYKSLEYILWVRK